MKKGAIKRGLLIFLLVLLVSLLPRYDKIVVNTGNWQTSDTIVIDAGHGGIDGGASNRSGSIAEKDINLAIAEELKILAEQAGWNVVMTRDTDVSLHEQALGAIRSRKTRDLKARVEIINNVRPAVAVSIHLNSFQGDTSVRGAQVFYPGSGGEEEVLSASKKLAEIIQNQINSSLQKGAERKYMIKKDAYLFRDVSCPIVLVECGFLSNPVDVKQLQTVKFQQNVAENILNGIMKFTGKKPPEKLEIIENSDNGTD